MSAPKAPVKNIDAIAKANPKLGEALQGIQAYLNANTNVIPGNKVAPPTFTSPTKVPG